MTINWSEAARRYTERREKKERLEWQERKDQMARKVMDDSNRRETESDTFRLIQALELFMASTEGKQARALLAAANRHIIFGEEREGGGYGVVYFIDGKGLRKSVEPMGMWMAYAKKEDIPEPKISPCNAQEAIAAAIDPHMGGKHPAEVMPWLRGELDRIANEAPQE